MLGGAGTRRESSLALRYAAAAYLLLFCVCVHPRGGSALGLADRTPGIGTGGGLSGGAAPRSGLSPTEGYEVS